MADRAADIVSKPPPIWLEYDFLSENDHASLLAESQVSEALYEPSLVTKYQDGRLDSGTINEERRRSTKRSLNSEQKNIFKNAIRERKEQICHAIGVTFPAHHKFEIEAVHNGDGAFFLRHIDTTFGPATRFRAISAVYYYSASPQRFSGGELRLYSLDQSQSITVEPQDNMMVFFPSIFSHEVMPVSVPSGRFDHGRFSVNCWINHAP